MSMKYMNDYFLKVIEKLNLIKNKIKFSIKKKTIFNNPYL